MAAFKNYYHILNVDVSASPEAIKTAFRQLARTHHPDVNSGNVAAAERFKEINEAYVVLSNPVKRQAFNTLLQARQPSGAAWSKESKSKPQNNRETSEAERDSHKKKGEGSSKTDASQRYKKKSAESKEQDEDSEPSSFGDLFGAFIKKGKKQSAASGKSFTENMDSTSQPYAAGGVSKNQRGKDITISLTLSLAEAEAGVVKKVTVQHNEYCDRCSGTGRVNGKNCKVCHGERFLVRSRKIDVRIPPGVGTGARVRVSQEGGKGLGNGEAGDLYLQIELSDESLFTVEGLDVRSQYLLPLPLAVLGGEIEVMTCSGLVVMMVPPGTQSGKVFRIKERGLQRVGRKGDHYVMVVLQTPQTLSDREKKLYQELLNLEPHKGVNVACDKKD